MRQIWRSVSCEIFVGCNTTVLQATILCYGFFGKEPQTDVRPSSLSPGRTAEARVSLLQFGGWDEAAIKKLKAVVDLVNKDSQRCQVRSCRKPVCETPQRHATCFARS